jgi:hypothetical protein
MLPKYVVHTGGGRVVGNLAIAIILSLPHCGLGRSSHDIDLFLDVDFLT